MTEKMNNMTTEPKALIAEIERPASVQAAFEVFAGKPDTGPHATAMFRYIEALEAEIADLKRRLEEAGKVLRAVEHWASSRCPCHEETPNPCPLCGASVENLEACKAVEETFPKHILRDLRAARTTLQQIKEGN